MILACLTLCIFNISQVLASLTNLTVNPKNLLLEIGETTNITYQSRVPLVSDVELFFNHSDYFYISDHVTLDKLTSHGELPITGRKPISLTYLEPMNCTEKDSNVTHCRFNIAEAYVRVSVVKSLSINLATVVVGWMYFVAWSLSFYPQIILNFRRKSVTGLHFDFLLLNIIGFAAYSLYNLVMYYNAAVQAQYKKEHPRSPIPVLLNDVVFAVHALLACLVTAAQCFIYERDNQRLSKTCILVSSLLVSFACISGVAELVQYINVLHFVMCLSYIKMIVTLSKYFPQMYFNFKRKSTVGWSIGNVLLDFTGGNLDILQMVLQCINVDDWVAFYGNPVKFGLGLVSIFFDIIFIIQHYILYRGVTVVHAEYEGIENPISPQSTSPLTDRGSINPPEAPILDQSQS